jgi:NADH dehydrogenase
MVDQMPEVVSAHPQVVIVGGGFAGLQVAEGLDGAHVRVTIVDQHNFHTFLPLLYQVATAGLEPADIAYPIRTIFGKSRNVTFRHGRVLVIDWPARQVLLKDGSHLDFDHLVLATGASAEFFGVKGAREHALPLYTLADARHLRNHLLLALERRDAHPVAERPGVTFVVVGAGPTGVETAGALIELLEVCVRRDRLQIDLAASEVVIVDPVDRVLAPFPRTASRYAARILTRRGVTLRLGVSVVEVLDDGVVLSDGSEIEADGVIWAAGVSGTGTLAESVPGPPTPQRRVPVDADLSVPGLEGVWAVGDAAAVPTGTRDSDVCPQLAPVAIQSGRHCAAQILASVEGRPTAPFRYRDKGIMATIGRRAAVAALPRGPVLRGTLGWLSWLGLHLAYLIGFRNRLRVLLNWTWRYFDWPSGPRLIVADAETADEPHSTGQ